MLAEKFFFDKFFYYKSVEHGYWILDKKLSLVDFGKRTEDLLQLKQDFENVDGNKSVLGAQNDAESYTIAIIGDSYVWGQGVGFEDTVSQLLEKKLNQYKKTTVLSLGFPGDSVLDYLVRYNQARQVYPVDLYIFVLVDNDLALVNSYKEKYEQTQVLRDCRDRFPDQEPVYDLPLYDYLAPEKYGEVWEEIKHESWTTDFNLCILDQSLKSLPTDNAIYFVSQYYHEGDWVWKTYKDNLGKNQKKMLYITDGKTLEAYKRFWEDPLKYFHVSQKDFHPSKIAHRMFADLLSKEILTNARWKF